MAGTSTTVRSPIRESDASWVSGDRQMAEGRRCGSHRLRDGGFALRMFLPLVCQAFSTSDPARSFAELVELTRQIMPTQEELSSAPPRTWTDLARHLMHELPFDFEPDADRGYCRLLPRQMFRRPGHPIAGSLAREWEQRCWPDSAESPDYGLVMEMPGWIADHVLQYRRDRFGPPFTIVRFHWVQGRKSVHIYGGENSGSTGIDEDLIVELLTTYGLLRRRTGLHYDPQTRLCHHSSCPYYEANWCNTFPFVPNDYSECTFLPTCLH